MTASIIETITTSTQINISSRGLFPQLTPYNQDVPTIITAACKKATRLFPTIFPTNISSVLTGIAFKRYSVLFRFSSDKLILAAKPEYSRNMMSMEAA
ncbi:hypothetical protein D3C77_550110 [compost metagenome]